jgi:hypothetical protein
MPSFASVFRFAQQVDRQPLHAGHRGDGFAPVLAFHHEQRLIRSAGVSRFPAPAGAKNRRGASGAGERRETGRE